MPHGSGVFFLEEFGICGAAAFTDFLSDGGEELLCPLEYGMAASISRTGIAQQGIESFGSRIEGGLDFSVGGLFQIVARGSEDWPQSLPQNAAWRCPRLQSWPLPLQGR